MIESKDILPIPYLKKAAFTGSYEGLRFRFARIKKEILSEEGQKEERQALEIAAWEAPYGYDATEEEKKQRLETEFTPQGIQEGIDWLNRLWEAEPERWKSAKANW